MSDSLEFVAVSWVDATHTDHGTWKAEDIPDAIVMTSAGILVEENGNSIKVARDKNNGEDAWRHAIAIPSINVIKIQKMPFKEITADECNEITEDLWTEILFNKGQLNTPVSCYKVGIMGCKKICGVCHGKDKNGMEIYSYLVYFEDGSQTEIIDTLSVS